jgi:tryptophan synthase alpha chain
MTSPTALGSLFQACAAAHRAAFIPFLMAGDPDETVSAACVTAAARNGGDLIEIGIPYSDPLADGPTIARASQRAQNNGMTIDRALCFAERCAQDNPTTALIGFSYYNPIFVRGIDRAAADFAAAGLRGIIVPDLPLGEAQPLSEAFARRGLAVTLLIAPTTPLERARRIAAQCSDFVYVVSRMGITGADASVGEDLGARIAALRMTTDKPLAVGFGVDSPQTARLVARHADGVIVGSALIDRMEAAATGEEAVVAVGDLCARLAAACSREGSAVSLTL